ncbi:MAG: 50S ribosomal protein L15 [bacterium]|nr:50S ribosomal protein L15 [bacterium]
MPTRFKKRSRKYRGSRTHGWGSHKNHRYGGTKGGRGPGIKRSGHWKIWFYKYEYKQWLKERKGFQTPKQVKLRKLKEINLDDVERLARQHPEIVEHAEGKEVVNLNRLGRFKLLGRGNISRPLIIKVFAASRSAVEKVKAAGGEVVALL